MKYLKNDKIIYNPKKFRNFMKKKILLNQRINRVIYYFIIFITVIIITFLIIKFKNKKRLKIGVISVRHEINVGNNLLKYAISSILSELGFEPYIIGTHYKNKNISFIKKYTNLIIIKKNFSEIKKNDYDILMVNSDQTWNRFDNHFFDYGFLKFAEHWNIKKFVYGASLGYDYWKYNSKEDNIMKRLLKKFSGISIREKDSVDLIKQHLEITPEVVLDPTLLLDKKYYLKLIKKCRNHKVKKNDNYIFVYTLYNMKNISRFIKKASNELNYKIINYKLNNNLFIEDFIYYISHSKAVITNSFHGTVFSIIFNKPFVSFNYKAKGRLKSLGNLLGVKNRIISNYENPEISLLVKPLYINYTLLESLKIHSINFIKKNLDII